MLQPLRRLPVPSSYSGPAKAGLPDQRRTRLDEGGPRRLAAATAPLALLLRLSVRTTASDSVADTSREEERSCEQARSSDGSKKPAAAGGSFALRQGSPRGACLPRGKGEGGGRQRLRSSDGSPWSSRARQGAHEERQQRQAGRQAGKTTRRHGIVLKHASRSYRRVPRCRAPSRHRSVYECHRGTGCRCWDSRPAQKRQAWQEESVLP